MKYGNCNPIGLWVEYTIYASLVDSSSGRSSNITSLILLKRCCDTSYFFKNLLVKQILLRVTWFVGKSIGSRSQNIGESLADIQNKINVDLDNVHKWLIANNLTLNKEKTEHMLIGSRQRLNQCTGNPHIVIGNHTIQQVPDKKISGVIIWWAVEVDRTQRCTMQKKFEIYCSFKKSKTIRNSRRFFKYVQLAYSTPLHVLLECMEWR